MSPLPTQFTSRWDNRSRQSYDDAVCWHLLLGGDPAALAAAAAARRRLARFAGLHMTSPQRLHVTVTRVGSADLVTADDLSRMLARAQAELARTAPITVTMRRVIYHPEAIALSVSPASALAPVLAAACTATREVLGADTVDGERDEWVPHMTPARQRFIGYGVLSRGLPVGHSATSRPRSASGCPAAAGRAAPR